MQQDMEMRKNVTYMQHKQARWRLLTMGKVINKRSNNLYMSAIHLLLTLESTKFFLYTVNKL